MPLVHFIRDPLEALVSSYQYHLVSTENWLKTDGYQEKLRSATLDKGLEMEYNRSKQDSLQEEVSMYEFLKKQPSQVDFFTIRLEDIRDEHMFLSIMAALHKWIGAAHPFTPQQFKDCCYVSSSMRRTGAKHVSKVDEKDMMRWKLMAMHAKEIKEFRRRMEFPPLGLEEREGTTHVSMHWVSIGLIIVATTLVTACLKRLSEDTRPNTNESEIELLVAPSSVNVDFVETSLDRGKPEEDLCRKRPSTGVVKLESTVSNRLAPSLEH
jgi:hypothetical protein